MTFVNTIAFHSQSNDYCAILLFTVLYAVGDYIAQKSVATQNNSVDDKVLVQSF